MYSLAQIRRRLRMTRPHLTDDDIGAVVHEVRRASGQAGGQATSEAKRLAAAANGRKGGRPPKKRRKTRKPNIKNHGRDSAQGGQNER